MAMVPADRFRKSRAHLIPGIHRRICHHIQRKQPMRKQGLIHRNQAFGHHSLLHDCHAIGSILLLHPAIGLHQVLHIRHRHLLLVLQERVFLHISGQHTVFRTNYASRRRGRVHFHAEQLQRQRVEHPCMARLVLHDHWIVRRGGI